MHTEDKLVPSRTMIRFSYAHLTVQSHSLSTNSRPKSCFTLSLTSSYHMGYAHRYSTRMAKIRDKFERKIFGKSESVNWVDFYVCICLIFNCEDLWPPIFTARRVPDILWTVTTCNLLGGYQRSGIRNDRHVCSSPTWLKKRTKLRLVTVLVHSQFQYIFCQI